MATEPIWPHGVPKQILARPQRDDDDAALVDANQAVAVLGTMQHWACTRVNRSGKGKSYSVTISHGGNRVTAQRRTFVEAANAAMVKLRRAQLMKSNLKLTGGTTDVE